MIMRILFLVQVYDESATDSCTITVIATGIEGLNVNNAMAKFSPKAQAQTQMPRPAVKPSYTYQQPQGTESMGTTSMSDPLPGLKQPNPVTSNVKPNGITIPTFLQKNRK